ncbi:hypothetical protein [Phenylobacterium sp.]|uniref:hypothetical protein n=1 Tax=Phenylobacterium sp. TaxID=1871053 RepID=UPI0025EF7BDB|nr:hypothetical protein [Phenylobacterium sp.]
MRIGGGTRRALAASCCGASLLLAISSPAAAADEAQATALAPPPPGASDAALADIRREIAALKAESAAAKAAEEVRAQRIDALSRQFSLVAGDPSPATPAAELAAPETQPNLKPSQRAEAPPKGAKWGGFEPGKGLILMRSDIGEVNLGLVSYLRYLNQDGMDDTYTSSFGQPFDVTPREDFQLAKVQITLRGWLFDPRFGYNAYVWTSNASQGLGAQVVAAGNLNWTFNEHFRAYFGIQSVPSTRSTNRTFPYWLRNDNRPIADEFFRGSYTQGIWADGKIIDGLEYRVMLANNLSALGVQARQLDANIDTFSGALTWMPTTKEFGPANGMGDFEDHQKLATLFSAHFTQSTETPQSQPATDSIENTQIRLSDGTLIFNATAFGTGRITEVRYQMMALDAAFKYKGFALEGEYYARWLDPLKVEGVLPRDDFFDQGYSLQASAMVIPKTLMLYASGSQIFGQYGDPWDLALGLNYFPFQRRDLRVNMMGLWVKNSPVGYTAYPIPVGGNGFTFVTDFSLAF